jgi:hypothetical protein
VRKRPEKRAIAVAVDRVQDHVRVGLLDLLHNAGHIAGAEKNVLLPTTSPQGLDLILDDRVGDGGKHNPSRPGRTCAFGNP